MDYIKKIFIHSFLSLILCSCCDQEKHRIILPVSNQGKSYEKWTGFVFQIDKEGMVYYYNKPFKIEQVRPFLDSLQPELLNYRHPEDSLHRFYPEPNIIFIPVLLEFDRDTNAIIYDKVLTTLLVSPKRAFVTLYIAVEDKKQIKALSLCLPISSGLHAKYIYWWETIIPMGEIYDVIRITMKDSLIYNILFEKEVEWNPPLDTEYPLEIPKDLFVMEEKVPDKDKKQEKSYSKLQKEITDISGIGQLKLVIERLFTDAGSKKEETIVFINLKNAGKVTVQQIVDVLSICEELKFKAILLTRVDESSNTIVPDKDSDKSNDPNQK